MITIINVAAILLLIIVTQPSKKGAKIDQKTKSSILYCGFQYKISGILIGILLPLNIILIFAPTIKSLDLQAIIFIAITCAFVYAGVRLFLMSLRYEIEITKDGIIVKRIIKDRITISWKNVKRINYRRRAIEIYSFDDVSIRVPQMMNGYITFKEVIKKNIPESIIKDSNLLL